MLVRLKRCSNPLCGFDTEGKNDPGEHPVSGRNPVHIGDFYCESCQKNTHCPRLLSYGALKHPSIRALVRSVSVKNPSLLGATVTDLCVTCAKCSFPHLFTPQQRAVMILDSVKKYPLPLWFWGNVTHQLCNNSLVCGFCHERYLAIQEYETNKLKKSLKASISLEWNGDAQGQDADNEPKCTGCGKHHRLWDVDCAVHGLYCSEKCHQDHAYLPPPPSLTTPSLDIPVSGSAFLPPTHTKKRSVEMLHLSKDKRIKRVKVKAGKVTGVSYTSHYL